MSKGRENVVVGQRNVHDSWVGERDVRALAREKTNVVVEVWRWKDGE